DNTIAVTARLDSGSDTGVDDSDQITNDTDPALSGTGTDGDMVTVTLTGPGGYSHVISTTVAQGVWSVTF
ncbi:Ig-like domain-containing protein, partial [Vibrio lentus]